MSLAHFILPCMLTLWAFAVSKRHTGSYITAWKALGAILVITGIAAVVARAITNFIWGT